MGAAAAIASYALRLCRAPAPRLAAVPTPGSFMQPAAYSGIGARLCYKYYTMTEGGVKSFRQLFAARLGAQHLGFGLNVY